MVVRPPDSIAKTGLNLLRKFSSAIAAANSTSSASLKSARSRAKKASVTHLPVYVILSDNSSASRSRLSNAPLFRQLFTSSSLPKDTPLRVAPDALLSIQKGQPLMNAARNMASLRG
jgi:hypothetical protein